MKLATKLPRAEIGAYFVIWCSAVAYSIYNFFLISQIILSKSSAYIYFQNGWFWLDRMKDVSDYEWKMILSFTNLNFPWIIGQIVISEILRHTYCKLIPIWYITISLIYLTSTFNLIGTTLILLQPVIAILLIILNNKKIIWIVNISFVIFVNSLRVIGYDYYLLLGIDEDNYYMFMMSVSWITLKSLSSSIDIIDINRKCEMHFGSIIINVFAYTLYLPTLLFGPIEAYKSFHYSFNNKIDMTFQTRLKELLFNIFRFLFWIVFTEFSLHFIYVAVMQEYLKIVAKSSWAVYGLGYCMGQFFHLKYVVVYGFATSIMKFEGINTPLIPVCIGRVHLYSYMWKFFDHGLYKFLVRYIYLPTGGNDKNTLNKLLSSFLCFCFVFLWHGTQLFIFIWSVLNFIAVNIEKVSGQIAESELYKKYIENNLSAMNLRRLDAIISAPLMIMSAVSNFFFFGGYEVGLFYVNYIINANTSSNLILLLFVYTLCQVSTELTNFERMKRKRTARND